MRKTILIYAICIQSVCFGQVNYKYFSRTELEQDLAFFSEKLTSIHPLFLDKAVHNAWQDKLLSMKKLLKDSMTQNEFYLLLAPSLASINDGHSYIRMPFDQRVLYTKAGGLAFPFFVDIIDSKIFIAQYCGDDSTLFSGGEEIIRINGVSSADMVLEMQNLFGGSSIANRQKAVATNFRYYIWMIYGFEKNYDLQIKNKQHQKLHVSVPGISSEQFQRNIQRFPTRKNDLYSFSMDNTNKSSVLKIKSFGQLDSFCAFADSAFSMINKNRIQNLIIDIRGNGGGRSVVVDSLMHYLTDKPYTQYRKIEIRVSRELKERYREKYPDRYKWINNYAIDELVVQDMNRTFPSNNKLRFVGNLFLLTDKTTSSAAATFAGIFKELKIGVIIGEETGGTIGYYGDYWELSTPNTAIIFCIAPKRFIQYGGTDLDRGVIPDYLITNNGDAIINFTNSLIEKQRNANKRFSQ
jgi:hypothetical protein